MWSLKKDLNFTCLWPISASLTILKIFIYLQNVLNTNYKSNIVIA